MPSSLTQDTRRLLHISGRHSHVSISAFSGSQIDFKFVRSYVPSSILKHWMISTTGLIEWWPKFVNRTIANTSNENVLPNISGNILVIFVFLGEGLLVALISMMVEMWKIVFACIKFGYKFCVAKIPTVKTKLSKPGNGFNSSSIIVVNS